MAQLLGEHHNLPAMMTFVRDEIAQDMAHVQRQIAPGVRRGDRDNAPSITTEFE
jgi:hypothetical protein